jgi:uncharacterized protein (TIGR00661 family)
MLLTHPKKVLVTPLDWGLGHATRCIPIIHELTAQGCEVQIASSGDALKVLKEEFSELKFHEIASYNPRYSDSLPFVVKIILQLPKFLSTIRIENDQVSDIISKEKIDIIISDNRFGCRNHKTINIFITHQVNILLNNPWKWLSGLVNYFNHHQIKKFDECWVPDFENGFTGKLSKAKNILPRFIGMLSRLKERQSAVIYSIAAIISGPEPQRSLLEELLRKQLKIADLNYYLVKGDFTNDNSAGQNEAGHILSEEMNELIASSELIVCRSGYSSIMDLHAMKKKAIFIPTPGQTEQEYLARELERMGIAFYQSQRQFNLLEAIAKSKKYSGFVDFEHTSNLLQNAISDLLNFKTIPKI